MQNRDKTILQKLKDNAFYVALGLGLLAILAVVAVYTVQQSGNRVTDDNVDLNQASDYSLITTEEPAVEQTNGKTAKQTSETKRKASQTTEEITSENVDEESTEKVTETTEKSDMASDHTDGEQIPVTTDVGELNFGSGSTLTWPVKGDVILPYSMETTVILKHWINISVIPEC